MDGISINGGVARSQRASRSTARPTRAVKAARSGSLAFVPSPDAVQEVRVSTNTYDAQFGRTGGGTIAVSASAAAPTSSTAPRYYIHRDAALNSNLYENIVRGIPKEEIFHYNPGCTIGGRSDAKYDDRTTFFFYSFEGLKSGIPVSARVSATPTDLERAGDFSQSGVDHLRPAEHRQRRAAAVPRQHAFPRNRMDPVALNLLKYMPSAELAARRGRQQLLPARATRASTPTRRASCASITTSSANHRFFGRYGHNGRRETRAKAGREQEARTGGYHHRWNNVLSVDLTSTLSPTTVSSAARRLDAASPPRHSTARKTSAASIRRRSASRRPSCRSIPQRFVPIRVTDYGGASVGQGGGQDGVERRLLRPGTAHEHPRPAPAEVRRASSATASEPGREPASRRQPRRPSIHAQLHVAAAERRHLDGRRRRQRVRLVPARLHGARPQRPAAGPIFDWRSCYIAGFLQDDWRLSNRLTVNLGLRWDYEAPTTRDATTRSTAGSTTNGVALVCPACPASGLPTRAAAAG